jgi:hypothetical protein
VREFEPGEMVIIDKDGLRSMRLFGEVSPTHCIFEHVYLLCRRLNGVTWAQPAKEGVITAGNSGLLG